MATPKKVVKKVAPKKVAAKKVVKSAQPIVAKKTVAKKVTPVKKVVPVKKVATKTVAPKVETPIVKPIAIKIKRVGSKTNVIMNKVVMTVDYSEKHWNETLNLIEKYNKLTNVSTPTGKKLEEQIQTLMIPKKVEKAKAKENIKTQIKIEKKALIKKSTTEKPKVKVEEVKKVVEEIKPKIDEAKQEPVKPAQSKQGSRGEGYR
jgi:hypothetical protein